MALSGKSLNDFCCNWNCSQTNMKFISTHSISHFPHEWRTVCVCVICFPCWCSMTVLPSSSGSIFTVHLLLQNHSVTALYHLSLSLCASIPPPLSPPAACHICCMSQWLSVIKANYSLFWACGASCGSNTLLATHSCRCPRSSCMYSM